MLQCEKLLSLGSAERREVMERSGLCTFCLRHTAELECYGRGGLSKPKCTQPGCDGEHTPDVHPLMGTGGAGVNLVAGDEDEPGRAGDEFEYEHEDECEEEYEDERGSEYEGWWVGTIGAMEMPEKTGRSHDGVINRKPAQGGNQAMTGTKCPGERGHGSQVAEYSEGEAAGDEQWDSEGELPREAEGLQRGPPQHFPGGQARPTQLAGAVQSRARPRPRVNPDRQWEEARHSAWLRQLLSDSSSDEWGSEDEEQYGRFAESGRWMTELYGIPQHPTATLGRECSV
jgi:hypothetical protein